MEVIDVIKGIGIGAGGLAGLVAVNQLGAPLFWGPGLTLSMLVEDRRKVDAKALAVYQDLPSDFTALDYLVIASYVNQQTGEGPDLCRHMSQSVFDLYNKLIKRNDRGDLKRSVRLAAGVKERIGHMMLHVRDSGGVIPFETLRD